MLVDCLNEGLQALDKATEVTGKDYYLIYKNHDIDSDGYKYPLHTMSVVDSNNRLIAYTIKSWTDFKSSRCCWIDNLRQCFLDTASFLTKKLSDPTCNSVDSIIDRYSK